MDYSKRLKRKVEPLRPRGFHYWSLYSGLRLRVVKIGCRGFRLQDRFKMCRDERSSEFLAAPVILMHGCNKMAFSC